MNFRPFQAALAAAIASPLDDALAVGLLGRSAAEAGEVGAVIIIAGVAAGFVGWWFYG